MTHRLNLREWLCILCIFLSACGSLGTAQGAASAPVPPAITSPGSDLLDQTLVTSQPTVQPAAQAPVIRKALNLAYAHTPGISAHLQSLDVYYSEPVSQHRPVIIYVHGGGWSSGDKTQTDFKPEFFLNAGYVFVSINYRLSPQAKFPAHVQDVAAAIAWASQNIGQFGGDPNQLYISGHSAGGHLATLVATDDRYLKEQGLSLAALKGVISIDTAGYDLSIFASRCPNHILPELYSATFGQNPADWKQASPVTYIEAGKQIPPMIIIYSGDVGIGSEVLREQMAREFGLKLSSSQIVNEVFGVRGKNHAEINFEFGMPGDQVGPETLEFLAKLQNNS